jgi:hypothetical protein
MAVMHCLGDGRSRQCVVTRCSYCGNKTKRKGIDVAVKNSRRSVVGGERSKGASNTVHEKRKQQKRADADTIEAAKAKTKQIESQIRDNSNYISLKSMGDSISYRPESKAGTTASFSFKKKASETTSLLGGGKKKGGKARKPPPKSNLMDFLSSLND